MLNNDLSSSLKVQTLINSNRNSKQGDPANPLVLGTALKLMQSGSSIGEPNLMSHYYSDQNSLRTNPLFSNQMIKQNAGVEQRKLRV